MADGKLWARFEAAAGFNQAAMSKDERWLAANAMAGGFRIYDLRGNRELPNVTLPDRYSYNLSTTPDGNTLVVLAGGGVVDSPTAVYLAPFPQLPKEKLLPELDVPKQQELWEGLCSASEFRRQHVLQIFKEHAEQAAHLVKERVRPVSPKRLQEVAALLGLLEDDSAAVRDQAVADLKGVALEFESLLSAALEKAPAGETKNRLTRIFKQMTDPEDPLLPSVSLKEDLAGIMLLKILGTENARKVLESLAAGAAGARVTDEAAAALRLWQASKQ